MTYRHNRFRGELPRIAGHPNFWAVAVSLAIAAPGHAVERAWTAGSGNWATSTNWSPNGFVGFGDSARIGNLLVAQNAEVLMDVNSTNVGLTLQGRANLYTQGRQLIVNGPTLIDGNAPAGSEADYARLFVSNGAAATDFRTSSLHIAGEGTLYASESPTIRIDGPATVAVGGRLVGSGTIHADGNFVNGGKIEAVHGDMAIISGPGAALDLDGANTGSILLNGSGPNLTVVGAGLADAFDGFLFIGGGSTLNMQLAGPWTLGPTGSLHVAWIPYSGYQSAMQGAPFSVAGEVQINGTDTLFSVGAPTTFLDTAAVQVAATSVMQLNSDATFAGGEYVVGAGGSIRCNGAATVSGGSFVMNENGRVVFAGPTAMRGGDFAFSGPQSPTPAAVHFNGPTTWDGTIDIAGYARQAGDASVTGPTTVHAGHFDLDGPIGAVTWNIISPFALFVDHVESPGENDTFDGTMNIAGGFSGALQVHMSAADVPWTMNGAIQLTGDSVLFPTRLGGTPVDVRGSLNMVSGRAQVTAATHFLDSATLNLAAPSSQLRLNAPSHIEADTVFQGPGLLINGANGAMRLDDGVATASVGIQNRGSMRIEDGDAGIVAVNRFENVAGARLRVSIGGHAAGTGHDLLIVTTGPATLAGALDVELFHIGDGQFTPQVGDEFTIITAAGGIVGAFAGNPISCAGDEQFNWTVMYEPNEVTLQLTSIVAGHPGDMNCDCVVSVGDIGPFVAALTDPAGYNADYPDCSINRADVNDDGVVSVGDISGFVMLLTQ